MALDPTVFRRRVLSRETLAGAWLSLSSPMVAEIAGGSGLDWVLIDTEHGLGEHEALVPQVQGVAAGGDCASVVRVAANEEVRFKRVLDLGVHGVMVPWVGSAEEAQRAVTACRYPPRGIRGAASLTRATRFGGRPFGEAYENAHEEITLLIQIERIEALEEVEAIAAIEGVDVLFVGPLDLSISLGRPQDFAHPEFVRALERVSEAARRQGKACGILAMSLDHLAAWKALGYTFIAFDSDGGMVARGMRSATEAVRPAPKPGD